MLMRSTLAVAILALLAQVTHGQGYIPESYVIQPEIDPEVGSYSTQKRLLAIDPEVGFGNSTTFLPVGTFGVGAATDGIAADTPRSRELSDGTRELLNRIDEMEANRSAIVGETEEAENQRVLLNGRIDRLNGMLRSHAEELAAETTMRRRRAAGRVDYRRPYDPTRGLANQIVGEDGEIISDLTPAPLIQVRVRVIEVVRSDALQVQSVLDYISRNPSGARPTYTDGDPLNKTPAANRNLSSLTNFAQAGLVPATNGTGMLVNLTSKHINYVASLLASEFNGDLITAPEVVTTSGQHVQFVSGSKIPFVLGQNVVVGTSATTQQFFYKHVGAYIGVTPTIIPDSDRIQLKIVVRISKAGTEVKVGKDFSGAGVNTEADVRAIANVLQVQDGRGLVMGGLMGESDVEDVQKVPVLGDIPAVGFLFRSKATTRQKTETLIFVEARTLDDDANHARYESYENFKLSEDYVNGELLDNQLDRCGMYRAGFGTYLPPLSIHERCWWVRLNRKVRKQATHVDDAVE